MGEQDNQERVKLSLGQVVELAGEKGRRVYRCRFVRAGKIRKADNQLSDIEITPEAIRTAVLTGLFDKRAVFVDHAGFFEYPSLRNLVGVTSESAWDEAEQGANGIITLYSDAGQFGNLLDEIIDEGLNGPDIGLSLVFYPQWAPRDNLDDPRRIVRIRHVESIDFVFQPAADGRVLEALSSLSARESWPAASLQRPAEIDAELFLSGGNAMENETEETQGVEGRKDEGGRMKDENLASPSVTIAPEASPVMAVSSGNGAPAEPAPASSPAVTVADWMNSISKTVAGALIANSGLPAASRERLAAGVYDSPAAVEKAIEAERAYLARLAADNVVNIGARAPRGGHIQVGLDALEKVTAAAEALLSGTRPAGGVAPLSGIRELYMLLSGDYEMTGLFNPERVQFANVNSSTMAAIVANALNKRVVALFQEYPRWWEPIVTVEDFATLQQIRWIMLGGVGELPTVAEGAAYTELTWDDKTETADFVKKGGYLGITLETMDKDDTGKVQAAPRALAQAAWLTLAKAISGIFTSNSGVGPTLSDSVALFNAAHGNLGNTALSLSAWAAVRLAMRKQTELNSSERLGALTAPRFLLVPPDLEITALQVLASEQDYTYTSGSAAAPANVMTEGDTFSARMQFARERVVVVDLWTDADNWAAVADPRLYPTIGLGFRYGRVPEIFSVASPTAGLMFSNDTLPVKVRFFFATGPMDYRGLYKQNVG